LPKYKYPKKRKEVGSFFKALLKLLKIRREG